MTVYLGLTTMHGKIFSEFQKFVETAPGGADTWLGLLRDSGISRDSYDSAGDYPDDEAIVLIATAARKAGIDLRVLLEDFGTFIAPALMGMNVVQLDPRWKTLDLIEHTENVIHTVVREQDPRARPPYLRTIRTSENEVIIVYTSPRRMCALAKGIASGIAQHYHERIIVEDRKCMHQGDPTCVLSVRRID